MRMNIEDGTARMQLQITSHLRIVAVVQRLTLAAVSRSLLYIEKAAMLAVG
ncbi:MAG: hypothetical protein K0Q59_60 [Paenibacillus sp.]|jgi:hypothetical protein|nr:hypothetical protein [Paenibacillus sp.]